MEAEKSEDQVTLVTQTIGLPQQSFDLIADILAVIWERVFEM